MHVKHQMSGALYTRGGPVGKREEGKLVLDTQGSHCHTTNRLKVMRHNKKKYNKNNMQSTINIDTPKDGTKRIRSQKNVGRQTRW